MFFQCYLFDYRLVIDNLRNVELVLASGEIIQVNATENADLWWGIRGKTILNTLTKVAASILEL
jgi:hypothetical protein